VVSFGRIVVADSHAAWRVLETSHPPGWYVPRVDIADGALVASRHRSFCEWKGIASYWTVIGGDRVQADAAWSYENPSPAFAAMVGSVAFYPDLMDSCTVAGELVRPQAGGFYGGWVTDDVVGPFKGEPGTQFW